MKKWGFLLFVSVFIFRLNAQNQRNDELYRNIRTQDSLLFMIGFNTCNITQFERILSEEFIFVHDKDSLCDRRTFLFNLRNGLCKFPENYQSRRELVEGSMEIYPLYKGSRLYGAIQNGEHKFYETIGRKPERIASVAKFTHFWILEKGVWKLRQALSYDHQEFDRPINRTFNFTNDSIMEKELKELNIPILGLGLIEDGKLNQIKIWGNLQANRRASVNTIFNVASLTKPITAFVVLKLIEAGKWSLDEPLCHYWVDPDIANDPRSKKLTTRYVLSHQTGFPNWRSMNESNSLYFQFEPGTAYQYSGEGFEYLRRALEKKFQKSLTQLATEIVFNPLGMMNTQFGWSESVDSLRYAESFDVNGKRYSNLKKPSLNAADDLLTTVEDYSKFLVALLEQKGNFKAWSTEMMAKQIDTKPNKFFALGLEGYDLGNGNLAFSHSGADAGVRAIFFIIPVTKQGLLIVTNSDNGTKVYEKIITEFLGKYGEKIIGIEKNDR